MEKILWESIERLAPLAPQFRLGDLWRRRLDARAHARDGQAHSGRDAADAGRASDLRRRHARGSRRHRAQLSRRRRAPYRGAARRSGRRRRARNTRRIRAAIATPPIWSAASSAFTAISKSRCRPIRRSIPTARRSTPTSTCSRPRSTPGPARAITQFFFENDLYFRYLDRVRARGIDIPIVPGILPVQNFKAATNFAARAGASVPAWLAERFHGLDNDRGHAQADRRRGRRRAGDRSGRPRRHHISTSTP